jgi:long-chain fatty acid transport protein
MKRSIKLAVAAAMVLGSTNLFATNGDNLIGLGAKARGMGGVGIATSFGAESGLANPALITSVKNTSLMFGGTLFMPDVEFGSNSFDNAAGSAALNAMNDGTTMPVSGPNAPINFNKSDADLSVIPEVALAKRINENVVVGLGMYGVAGMGTDYRNTLNSVGMSSNGSFGMRTNLQLMRFAIPVAYEASGFSIGFAPMLQYGSLNIATTMPVDSDGDGMPDTADPQGVGVSEDLGMGYELGLAYTIDGLTIGAKYQSAIDMEYDHILSSVTQQFGLSGISDNLEQPAEFGIGASYEIGGNTIAFDYKQIDWESAKGYEDFGWEKQNVIALGYQYEVKGDWAIRLGYNYASNPIKEFNGAGARMDMTTGMPVNMTADGMPTNYAGAAKNFFNMAGFPAVVEQHYTVGGTLFISERISFDLAYTYAPEVDFSYDTTAMAQGLGAQMAGGANNPNGAGATMFGMADTSADVTHSQSAITFAMNCEF